MDRNTKRLRQAAEKMPNYREVLELAEQLLVEKQRLKTRGLFPSFKVDSAKAKLQIQEGFPYLRPSEIPLDSGYTAEYFFRLLELFKGKNPEQYAVLKKAVDSPRLRFERLLVGLLQNKMTEDSLKKEWGEEGRLLLFFLTQSIKPTFEAQAKTWRAGQKDLSWSQGYCPFCGAFSDMGEIRQEGKRFLHCPICATEWETPRMQCPFCGNHNPETLTYFQVEGEMGYRVDLCENCKTYLKTADSRERDGSLDGEVEDYLTLHLDFLAQEEGYRRPERLFVEMH
jgi:FdhE protein